MTSDVAKYSRSIAATLCICVLVLFSACSEKRYKRFLGHAKTEIELKTWLDEGRSVTDPTETGYNGRTPLHYFADGDKVESVQMARLLLDRGAVVNAKDNQGETPLHKAAKVCNLSKEIDINRQTELVRLLIQHGADPNAKNNQGETPLHYAFGPPNLVSQELLRAGADMHVLNKNGLSPLEYAYGKTYPGAQRPTREVAFVDTHGVRKILINQIKGTNNNSSDVATAHLPIFVITPVSRNDVTTYNEMKNEWARRYFSQGNNYGGIQLLPGQYEIVINIESVFSGVKGSLRMSIPAVKSASIEVKAGSYYELSIDDKGILAIQLKSLQGPFL